MTSILPATSVPAVRRVAGFKCGFRYLVAGWLIILERIVTELEITGAPRNRESAASRGNQVISLVSRNARRGRHVRKIELAISAEKLTVHLSRHGRAEHKEHGI